MCHIVAGLSSEHAIYLPTTKYGKLNLSMSRPPKLYHCTTPKKVQRYHQSGRIIAPVRGFSTIEAAMAWCIKTGRTIILEIDVESDKVHKLPDHHNDFGTAWWNDGDISGWKCVFSAEKDA